MEAATHKNALIALAEAVTVALRQVDREFPIHDHVDSLTIVCESPGVFLLKFVTKAKPEFANTVSEIKECLDERINQRPDAAGNTHLS